MKPIRHEPDYKKYYSKFEHFKLRLKIGQVCYKKKLLVKNIKNLLKNKKNITSRIKIEKLRLKKLSMAKKNINNFFKKEINNFYKNDVKKN